MPTTLAGSTFVLALPTPEAIFTPEDFSDQHRLIAQTAEAFAEQDILPQADAMEHQDFAITRALLLKASELGLTSADVPESYGGLGLDFLSSAIIADRIAKYGSFSAAFGAHVGIGILPVLFFGSEDQKQRYLPRLTSGEWVGAYALSEAGSGSDALAARTRADLTADGKHYRLNGEKMWITNGGFADLFTVFAKINGEQFTAFLVEKSFPGVSTGAEEKKMGIKGSSTRPLVLSDALVPVGNVLGEVGRGHIIAFNILNVGRFKLGAACVGGARNCLHDALAYARQRKAFGKPIAEFGLVQQMLADIVIGLYGCESAVYRTVGLIDARLGDIDKTAADAPQRIRKALEEFSVECSIIKVFGSEMLDQVVDHNVQIHGGYGFVQEYPAERPYRDSRVNRIFEGTNEINRLLITGQLLKKGLKGELPLLAAVQKVSEDVLAGAATDPDPQRPLAAEQQSLEGARKLTLLLAGAAFQRFREQLEQQQEILAGLSDLLIEVYVAQSVLLRALKMPAEASNAALARSLARVTVAEGLERVQAIAHRLLPAIAEGDMLRTQVAMVRRLLKHDLVDTIALRREIAAATLSAGRYPLA
ncbi:MAG: acyl-CoA dehydrogenase family protein [Terriglobales bacterium]